jgi:hypothetical protein
MFSGENIPLTLLLVPWQHGRRLDVFCEKRTRVRLLRETPVGGELDGPSMMHDYNKGAV